MDILILKKNIIKNAIESNNREKHFLNTVLSQMINTLLNYLTVLT